MYPEAEVYSTNWCRNPQVTCPRREEEGYEKCQTICGQEGHAETNAIKLARDNGFRLQGATAIVIGHYHSCPNCAKSLRDEGIKQVTFIDR